MSNETLRSLLFEISFAAGYQGMVMGQFIDLYFEEKNIDFETLKILHAKKTGAMIRGAARVGAISSEKKNIDIENITKYGEEIGLAFQIWDDILDVISDNETLGKTAGKDAKEGKLIQEILRELLSFYNLLQIIRKRDKQESVLIFCLQLQEDI